MNRRDFWPSVEHLDAHDGFIFALLGVGDPHFEESIGIERGGVEQFVFIVMRVTTTVLAHQRFIGKRALRIDIHHAIERMRGQRILMKPNLFRVLAVIAFAVGQAKQALFENRILAVPQRNRETNVLILVAPTRESVFAPAIGATARVIVRKRIPRVSIR